MVTFTPFLSSATCVPYGVSDAVNHATSRTSQPEPNNHQNSVQARRSHGVELDLVLPLGERLVLAKHQTPEAS